MDNEWKNLKQGEIRIDCTPNDPVGGQKVGTPPVWLTITHLPSMQCVRILQQDGESQYTMRNKGLTLLDLALDGYEVPREVYRERLEEVTHA